MRSCLGGLLVLCLASIGFAQSTKPLAESERKSLQERAQSLHQALDKQAVPKTAAWADAAIFAKGLTWGLDYDQEYSPADIDLLEKAVTRGTERQQALQQASPSWTSRRGKVALGYVSRVDGSVQPYGLIIPSNYDPKIPIRLDVVLHGSSKPVGMSELRFLSRFDEGDGETRSAPEVPYIELHPLGRVENCYRWSGETDVFEAIENVCQRYNIDRDRIVLRGMSMGASGTWHLGLKHPDRFVALGPYCGYVDTHRFSETPIPGFVVVGELPQHQELGLRMLDSVDYAANAGVVPAIACIGEKDVFFQAHVIMEEAMKREGLTMINLISPGTGHVIDPKTHAEQLRQIGQHVEKGKRHPAELRFVTWTLKHNRCHWLEILQLGQHYSRAEFSAKLQQQTLEIAEPTNIMRMAIALDQLPSIPNTIRIGTAELPIPKEIVAAPRPVVLALNGGQWQIESVDAKPSSLGKRPGLQGPIDDAFTTPFLCVRGTGQPWSSAVQAYADASLDRFAAEWRQYFRGDLPIKKDVDVTPDDVQNRNLILFGDPGSNPWIAKVLPQLPIEWSKETLKMDGKTFASTDHLPALIAPSPLPTASQRYVVINSGHTFRESELNKFNYLLFPRWGDWAILQVDPAQSPSQPPKETVLHAGYFDEAWKFPALQK